MLRSLLAAGLCLVFAFGSGCVSRVQVGPAMLAPTPRLVAIAPDVWVLEDHASAVFYSDGLYWTYENGRWSRSRSHSGEYTQAEIVPDGLGKVRDPNKYVRYRGQEEAIRRPAPSPSN